MLYHITMTMEHLLENEQAVRVFDQLLPGMRQRIMSNPQSLTLSVEQVVRYSRVPEAEKILIAMEENLQALNTPENRISPSEAKLIRRFQEIDRQEKAKLPKKNGSHVQDAIYPGQPWLDTKGERIQAHGGAVYYENGVYYWYGENKEHTDGKNGVWTWGIKVYASTDLCNWEDRGYLIPPVLDDPNSPLFPARCVDRPHILKCESTGKYVCWIKISGPDAAFSIWQADSLLGPYEQVEAMYRPGGHTSGDFDLIADETSDKGFLFVEVDHTRILCMELSPDYLHAEREIAVSYPDLKPPFTREAPALFDANGRKYMLTSGMTGYVPNKSDSAAAASWDAPFVSIGDPHVADASNASFNSQICKVFKVAGKDDLFVAMADRWLPEYHVDARIADLFTRAVASRFYPEQYQATEEEMAEMYAANVLETANTAISDYVWLPLRIEKPSDEYPQGRVLIEWKDAWRI